MAQFEDIDFPGWEVIRKIGEGSFGGVYEIHRTLPSGRVEKCALKKLAVPKDNGEIQELISQAFSMESITAHYKNQMGELVNEYSLTQELNSCKNVVGCYDVRFIQHDDGIGWDIYIRMELLNPLRQALSAEYQEDTVLRLGLDMCNALLACQEHSIIHRDIKPENILVSDRGEFKLGDFGIAKVSERTGTGTMTGTTGYMAPEVANRQHYGAQADIYSLGMVLYWMMNQRTLPFLPYPPAIPSAIQRQEAANRRLAGEAFPPPVNGSRELKAIVMKACAYSTAERYQSVQELHQALSACTQPPLIYPQERTVLDIPHPDEPTQDSTTGAFEGIQSKNALPKLPRPVASPNRGRENTPRKKKSFKWLWIPVCLLLIGSGVFGIKQVMNTSPTSKYRAAQELLDAKNYSSAAKAFEALGDYSDSSEKAQEARQMQEQEKKEQSYQSAQKLLDAKNYSSAAKAFEALGDYSDSSEKAQEARKMQEQEKKEQSYQSAQKLLDAKDYSGAAKAFEALGDYSDSAEKAQEAHQMQEQEEKEQSYQAAQALLDAKDYSAAAEAFAALGDYSDSAKKTQEARQLQEMEVAYQAAQALLDAKDYSGAVKAFESLGDYGNSAEKAQTAQALLDVRNARAELANRAYDSILEPYWGVVPARSCITDINEDGIPELILVTDKAVSIEYDGSIIDSRRYAYSVYTYGDNGVEALITERVTPLSPASGCWITIGVGHVDGIPRLVAMYKGETTGNFFGDSDYEAGIDVQAVDPFSDVMLSELHQEIRGSTIVSESPKDFSKEVQRYEELKLDENGVLSFSPTVYAQIMW